MRGGGFRRPKNFSSFSLEKAHFGGYLMHSDVLILKSWFTVHKVVRPILSVLLRRDAVHGA